MLTLTVITNIICFTDSNNFIHVDSDSEPDLELTSPFVTSAGTSTCTCTTPAAKTHSNLMELMQSHKLSLKQDEDNLKRIRVCRDDFWNESIVSFKNPEFDCSARPRVVFEGEAGVDAGGLKREYGAWWPIMQGNKLFSSQAKLFEGLEERKLPIYSIDCMYSRLFQLAGKMVAYLIIHLDIGIPCLSTAVYNYISTASVTPDCCSIDDIVDLDLKELISQVS